MPLPPPPAAALERHGVSDPVRGSLQLQPRRGWGTRFREDGDPGTERERAGAQLVPKRSDGLGEGPIQTRPSSARAPRRPPIPRGPVSEAGRSRPDVSRGTEAPPMGALRSGGPTGMRLGPPRTGGDACPPRNGFLSESAAFAERVRSEGLVWIGPSPEAIRSLGDKLSARALALRARVPSSRNRVPHRDELELKRAADRIGYPWRSRPRPAAGARACAA